MKATDQQLTDIFWEIVGDPEDNEYDYVMYLQGLPEDATVEEATAFAKIVKDVAEESKYDV